MPGLPLVGDPYEEYVLSVDDLEPSKLMFPNFLSDLLGEFYKLSKDNGGHVTFQVWCDHFHNQREDTSSFTSLKEQHIYVAAFIAQWLCCYVVVGGGSYIRPGVLLMASWIVSGRKISLAPPALCSLYYSLRRISMHPIAPSYEKRAWPVHYIAGWIGIYLKKPFKTKARGDPLPNVKGLSMRPTMVNTMFRAPTYFSPAEARTFLANPTKSFWNPYTANNLVGVDQLQRSFSISSHRGMLPWRRATDVDDLLIAEPYHPERVARQLTLRQQVPYDPLVSLYTMEDTGVAYAYWSHLLRHDRGEFECLFNDAHKGLSSVAWNHWWVQFMRPFNRAFKDLNPVISNGRDYNSRKSKFLQHGEKFISPRKLSEGNLVVIKEVTVRGQAGHVATIQKKAKEVMDQWNPILSGFLTDDKPHVTPKKVREIRICS
jgi:hypothetical protein